MAGKTLGRVTESAFSVREFECRQALKDLEAEICSRRHFLYQMENCRGKDSLLRCPAWLWPEQDDLSGRGASRSLEERIEEVAAPYFNLNDLENLKKELESGTSDYREIIENAGRITGLRYFTCDYGRLLENFKEDPSGFFKLFNRPLDCFVKGLLEGIKPCRLHAEHRGELDGTETGTVSRRRETSVSSSAKMVNGHIQISIIDLGDVYRNVAEFYFLWSPKLCRAMVIVRTRGELPYQGELYELSEADCGSESPVFLRIGREFRSRKKQLSKIVEYYESREADAYEPDILESIKSNWKQIVSNMEEPAPKRIPVHFGRFLEWWEQALKILENEAEPSAISAYGEIFVRVPGSFRNFGIPVEKYLLKSMESMGLGGINERDTVIKLFSSEKESLPEFLDRIRERSYYFGIDISEIPDVGITECPDIISRDWTKILRQAWKKYHIPDTDYVFMVQYLQPRGISKDQKRLYIKAPNFYIMNAVQTLYSSALSLAVSDITGRLFTVVVIS